jgi:hypothetical protein
MEKIDTTTIQATLESVVAILQEFGHNMEVSRAEFDARMTKERAEYAIRKKESDERTAKLEADLAETGRYIQSIGKQLGDIGANNGYFAEEHFYNSFAEHMHFAGVKYDKICGNTKLHIGKVEDEFDIIMFNGKSVAIIEVKYRVHPTFLERLTTKKVNNFKILFPEYANHAIYLAIASMSFSDEILKRAEEMGVGIIKQKGDTIECQTENIRAY